MRKVIAVDFDGTVVDHQYPDVGEDAPGAVDVLRRLTEEGARIILWTMRHRGTLEQAVGWFAEKGIPLFGIQSNPEQAEWTSSPKSFAHMYIDDAAFGCPLIQIPGFRRPCVDWAAVGEHFFTGDKHV